MRGGTEMGTLTISRFLWRTFFCSGVHLRAVAAIFFYSAKLERADWLD